MSLKFNNILYVLWQVNNAGVFMLRNFLDTTLEDFDAVINTNLRGPFYLTQLCLPYLEKTKG